MVAEPVEQVFWKNNEKSLAEQNKIVFSPFLFSDRYPDF